jgi:hypothetical protein
MKYLLSLLLVLSLSACVGPKVVFEADLTPDVHVVLTDGPCEVPAIADAVKAAGVEGVHGGFGVIEGDKRKLCWKEIAPGVAAVQDEKGASGTFPMEKP